MSDLAFEALAEVTGTDWNVGRGELNKALASIREQFGRDNEEFLPAEIRHRAQLYRSVFTGAALTPLALSKHWLRVVEETKPRKPLPPPKAHPPKRTEQNLLEARKLLQTLWGDR